MKIRNGKKNVSFSLNQLHTGLWLSGGPFSLLHIFVLHKLFLLCSWPPLIPVQIFWCRVSPLLLFMYHVYFGWLSLKTLMFHQTLISPQSSSFPKQWCWFWQFFFSSSLWDGTHPEVCSWPCPRLGILGQGPASWARQTDKFQKRNDNIETEAVQPWDSNKSYYWVIHASELLRSRTGRSKTKTGISRVRREIGKVWGRCWSWV